jgi:hypothetical protein
MDDETTVRPNDKRIAGEYGSLGRLLHIVRWAQHLLSIIAEVLILLSFAMSGMDVSLGGVMVDVPLLKTFWAGIFALGIDTAFALSWVRVRRHLRQRQWLAFIGNGLLALGISFVVFEPVVIQLYQQALDIDFNHALSELGISLTILVYARAGVAVALGAILALTNGESGTADSEVVLEAVPVKGARVRRHRFAWFKRLWQWIWATGQKQSNPAAPVTVNQEPPAQVATLQTPDTLLVEPAQVPAEEVEAPAELPVTTETAIADQETAPLSVTEASAQPEPPSYDTPEQRVQRVSEIDFTGLSAHERVAKVLELFPDLSDRELGKLSGIAAATAKKHREMLKSTPPDQAQVTEESDE